MTFVSKFMVVALPLALAAGCTTLEGDDKALLEKAAMSADAAKSAAMKAAASSAAAVKAAEMAAKTAQQAARAAERAAAEARAAGDKADRIFRKGLRK